MNEGTIALLTLLGAIIGFVLSEISQYFRNNKNEAKQKESVRKIVYLEIEKNLELLRAFNKTINDPEGITLPVDTKGDKESESVRKYQLALRFLGIPFPTFLTLSYESQLQYFSLAFQENEINKIFSFYNFFPRLTTIKNYLKSAKDAYDRMKELPRDQTTYHAAINFLTAAPPLWDEMSLIICEILEHGNPISMSKSDDHKPI
jgi:hypothetical protein